MGTVRTWLSGTGREIQRGIPERNTEPPTLAPQTTFSPMTEEGVSRSKRIKASARKLSQGSFRLSGR